jgi:hypothetical protein
MGDLVGRIFIIFVASVALAACAGTLGNLTPGPGVPGTRVTIKNPNPEKMGVHATCRPGEGEWCSGMGLQAAGVLR